MTTEPKYCTVDDLSDFFEKSLAILPDMKYNAEKMSHVFVMANLCKVFENTFSIIKLFEAGVITSVNIILRNSLESYVNSRNTCDDEEYVTRIFLYDLRIKRESLKILIKRDAVEDKRYLEILKNVQSEIDDLSKSRKIKDCGPIDSRFSKAGLEELYKINYRMMSSDSHNSLMSLQNSFIDNSYDKTSLTLYKKPKINDLHLGCHTSIWLLYDLMAHVKNFLMSVQPQDDLPSEFQEYAMALCKKTSDV